MEAHAKANQRRWNRSAMAL